MKATMHDTLRSTWQIARSLWNSDESYERLDAALAELRYRQPAPTFWLLGKTQSGKSTLVKFLTGADDAEIGSGFRPCTRTSRKFPFPNEEAPLVTFLDTRGFDEPGYDPTKDVAAFSSNAHLVIATVKIADFAQNTLKRVLEEVRRADSDRPVMLVLTCLHEVTSRHPKPYPFATSDGPEPFSKLIGEHRRFFGSLVDAVVPVDLTRPEEGFDEQHYGGDAIKSQMLALLPESYRESLSRMGEALKLLKDLHQQHAGPIIASYASMAASAAALPVPFVDLALLPAVQVRMVYHLSKLYDQELSTARILELAGSLGIGLLARQAVREVAKLVPFIGSALGATLAWVSTYALGRAICLYFEEVHDGHLPKPERLKKLYAEQFETARSHWGVP